MASVACFFIFALLCTAYCNPIGEAILPSVLPSVGTTVCETTPNVLANLGLGLNHLPTPLALQLLAQTLVPSLGQTTVCDSKTNVGLPVLSPYGVPLNTAVLPTSTQTVCESASNVAPINLPVPYGLSLPGLLKGLPLPGALVSNLPGSSTTVCESASTPLSPFIGLPSTILGGVGLPLGGLGLPFNGMGLPVNGLGLSVNGLGLPLNGLAGLVSSLGLPVM